MKDPFWGELLKKKIQMTIQEIIKESDVSEFLPNISVTIKESFKTRILSISDFSGYWSGSELGPASQGILHFYIDPEKTKTVAFVEIDGFTPIVEEFSYSFYEDSLILKSKIIDSGTFGNDWQPDNLNLKLNQNNVITGEDSTAIGRVAFWMFMKNEGDNYKRLMKEIYKE
jgi:hypothetical protein